LMFLEIILMLGSRVAVETPSIQFAVLKEDLKPKRVSEGIRVNVLQTEHILCGIQ